MEHASQNAASLCASGEQPTNNPAAVPNHRKNWLSLQHQRCIIFAVTAVIHLLGFEIVDKKKRNINIRTYFIREHMYVS